MYDSLPLPTHLVTAQAEIRPWVDPTVDSRGADPRGSYAEKYWLSVIGPTAAWIMRRFAERFDQSPDGFTIDLDHTATTMGLSFARGFSSPFGRALHRCVMFGLAMPMSNGFAVRRRLPMVTQRHLERLPDDVRAEHDEWARRTMRVELHELQSQLVAAGLPGAVAVRAAEAAALAA